MKLIIFNCDFFSEVPRAYMIFNFWYQPKCYSKQGITGFKQGKANRESSTQNTSNSIKHNELTFGGCVVISLFYKGFSNPY